MEGQRRMLGYRRQTRRKQHRTFLVVRVGFRFELAGSVNVHRAEGKGDASPFDIHFPPAKRAPFSPLS
jgi:hypothetical protein